MKRLTTVALMTLLLLCLTACNQPQSPAPAAPAEEELPAPPPPPTQEELDARLIEEMLDQMTTEELVGQLFFPRCPGANAVEDIQTYHLGGYILFGRDFKAADGSWLTESQLTSTLAAYQDAASIPLLIGADEEGGTVIRASRNPNLFSKPCQSPQRLAKNGIPFAEDAREKSLRLLELGIQVNLAPVADVSTNSANFIYDRALGKNAEATAAYVGEVAGAMSDAGIGSVLKHFPGYGSNADTHTGIAIDQRPLETFRASDFLPFSAGIRAGGGRTAVLVSHNIMTCVDPELPASLSPAVHELLRNELGFGGVVMTDDLAMDAVKAYAKDGAAAVLALQAGNDLIITTDYHTQIPQVLEAVQNGTLDPALLRCACRRVLKWKQELGLLPDGSAENQFPIV